MSLLDDLKQQAEQQQKDESEQAAQARREAVYQETLRPRMRAILNYLGELTEQLKLVDPDVRQDYTLPGIGELKGLRQGGYVVNADSTDQTRIIRLRFNCSAAGEQEFAVKPKTAADETRDFLESHNMRYAEWPIRDSASQLIGINFQLQVKVDISFIFQADLEQGAVKMITTNFSGFEVERSIIQPGRIDDQWLDKLGNYILRKHQKLYNLEIDASEKDRIRQRLEDERRIREEELQLAMQREQEELEEKRRNSLMGRLETWVKKPKIPKSDP